MFKIKIKKKKEIVFPKHVDTHSALLDFILTTWFDYLTKVDESTTEC